MADDPPYRGVVGVVVTLVGLCALWGATQRPASAGPPSLPLSPEVGIVTPTFTKPRTTARSAAADALADSPPRRAHNSRMSRPAQQRHARQATREEVLTEEIREAQTDATSMFDMSNAR